MYALMIYSLKVGACLAVFYLFFKLLLSRETFHRLNRIVVLAAMVLSFILPFCVITIYRELPAAPEMPAAEQLFEAPAEPQPEELLRSWHLRCACFSDRSGGDAALDVRIGFRRDPHDPPGTS